MHYRTQPYPDNDKGEWWVSNVRPPTRKNGTVNFAYAVYPNKRSYDLHDLPFYVNSHHAQLREKHFRIRMVDGKFLHRSGELVLPSEIPAFLNTPAAYHWEERGGLWRASQGSLTPYSFPSYQGVDEYFDPQWVREEYELSLEDQISAILTEQMSSVMARLLFGDHQGTTLNLKVGASADDAYQSDGTTGKENGRAH